MKTCKLAAVLALTLQPLSHAEDERYFRIAGPVAATITACSASGYVTWTNTPTNATFTVQTAAAPVGLSGWVDYVQVPATNPITTCRLFDPNPPAGMVFIPAGTCTMGDTFSEEYPDELPLHTNSLSAFYLDQFEVSKALWDEVEKWAVTNGYSFDNAGLGKAADHPVHTVCWYDCVKWCNARSEKEGRMPAYYTESAQTNVYRTGTNDLQIDWVKWSGGYRLPTEAEWEKAARGGMRGHRFPWADTDTISHSQANYYSYWPGAVPDDPYDVSPAQGFHPDYEFGDYPYTSPVGSFAANGYGLCDMAGNLWEWCWDWYDFFWYGNAGATQEDTRGPAGLWDERVLRGGSWHSYARFTRCANRSSNLPFDTSMRIGFRCAQGL